MLPICECLEALEHHQGCTLAAPIELGVVVEDVDGLRHSVLHLPQRMSAGQEALKRREG